MSDARAPSALAHQFEDLEQQRDTATFGIWVFLVTEVMFFGGLFASYTVYRSFYLPDFEIGSRLLNVTIGATNTAVLLTSSFTMAMAVRSAQIGRRGALSVFLILTMALGILFLGLKAVEYHGEYVEHIIPAINFASQEASLRPLSAAALGHIQMFMCFYFFMTGVHGIHMIIGIGLLISLLIRTKRGDFASGYSAPVEITGLYWHFVDIIWIFLFPLLYLIGGRY